MTSGYHQVEIAEENKDKTAFVSPHGLYQYCRMPFGLAGARGTFQSVIDKDMAQVLDTEDIMAYLNDVICFHPTFEEHLEEISRLPNGQEVGIQIVRQEMSVCNQVH